LFTFGIYVAGMFAQDLRTVQAVNLNVGAMRLMRGISYLLPNFENFNVMGAVAHGEPVAWALVWQATIYAVLYCAIVLAAGAAVFSRRDLK
jgi:ABC-type transport system involved in multi-copper enzyme maturation permease subunit